MGLAAIGVGAAFFVQRSNDAQKAAQALTEASSGGAKSAGSVMRGDGAGCKNKAIAAELVALDDTNPRYIEIWAKGMQDKSCRGFSVGLTVSVDGRTDGMACVKSAEDAACFWVKESVAP